MKEYVTVKRSASSKTVVTVTLVDGTVSSSFACPTYLGEIAKATKAARVNAQRGMSEAMTAMEGAQ